MHEVHFWDIAELELWPHQESLVLVNISKTEKSKLVGVFFPL